MFQKVICTFIFYSMVLISGCMEQTYIQQDCILTDRYLAIWLSLNSSAHEDSPKQSFIFTKKGITISVSPLYYAPDWQSIEAIRYFNQSSKKDGLLTIDIIENDGDQYTEKAGIINQKCWMNIETFIKENNIDVKLVTEVQSN